MKRHGAVIVFKKGTPPEEAAAALTRIAKVLDTQGKPLRLATFRDRVQEFDDDSGGPVGYSP